jgi:hypothetical protein
MFRRGVAPKAGHQPDAANSSVWRVNTPGWITEVLRLMFELLLENRQIAKCCRISRVSVGTTSGPLMRGDV